MSPGEVLPTNEIRDPFSPLRTQGPLGGTLFVLKIWRFALLWRLPDFRRRIFEVSCLSSSVGLFVRFFLKRGRPFFALLVFPGVDVRKFGFLAFRAKKSMRFRRRRGISRNLGQTRAEIDRTCPYFCVALHLAEIVGGRRERSGVPVHPTRTRPRSSSLTNLAKSKVAQNWDSLETTIAECWTLCRRRG